jgi:hypothetical protein
MRHAAALAIALGAVSVSVAVAATTPTVSTAGATGRTETTAVLNATINPNGSATTYYFQVGLTTSYGSQTATRSAGHGTRPVAASAGIGGLTPGTVYHYRVVATNVAGTATGADRTFKTAGNPPPTATTGGALGVGHAWAIVSGTVGTEGQATHWAFQFGPTVAYGYQSFGGDIPNSATPVGVVERLTGLATGTTFHYRLVAFHGTIAVSYGADQTFTTLPFPRRHARLSARTLPTIAASKPYLFTTTGTLTYPSSLPPGIACTGNVVVRFVAGRRSVAVRSVPVQPNCTFFSQVLFHRLIHRHKARLRVEVRFHGNGYLVPANARTQRVQLGI